MKIMTILVSACVLLSTLRGTSQTDFRVGFEADNPLPIDTTLPLEEKVLSHQSYLLRAESRNDTLHRIYGNLYLFYDYLIAEDYPAASEYLLKAEQLADASQDAGWQGWVTHRRGILWLRMDEHQKAIQAYRQAAEYCAAAGDSLCLGESLEQIGAMYSTLDSFELARPYIERAIPLIEKFGGKKQLAATLNNFGIYFSRQEKAAEAIPYFERAIDLYTDLQHLWALGKAKNNLADAYRRIGKHQEAIDRLKECIAFNRQNHLRENMINNYMGLYVAYDELGDYQSANEYLIAHFNLRDSLIGAQTQERIAALEARYDSQQKELELEKHKTDLAVSRVRLERTLWVLGLTVLAILLGIWQWRRQIRRSAAELIANRENLDRMTRLLHSKNSQIGTLEKQLSEQRPPSHSSEEGKESYFENMYHQRILTEDDWVLFKMYFEKTYPGYIRRLRSAFPTMSESEERLFLFLKLRLTSRETAVILGISQEGVKKTRSRLRKRLDLAPKVPLSTFVEKF